MDILILYIQTIFYTGIVIYSISYFLLQGLTAPLSPCTFTRQPLKAKAKSQAAIAK